MTTDPEPGDVVVYRSENWLGEQEWEGVVESVQGDQVDLGIDGVVSVDDIVEVRHKSPSEEDG